MQVLIKSDASEVCTEAARRVAECVRRNPQCVLGLPTGGTPELMYAYLVRMHREEGLDFSKVTTFNLDEYVGLPPEHPQSFHYFMRERFFQHVNLHPANTHIPNGMAENLEAEAERYEALIDQAGGIDLQVLGIGENGHVAFNEPVVSSVRSRTRVVRLTEETRRVNSRFFASLEEVPHRALTMGLGTILEQTRRCILLATGYKKAKAVWQAIEGPVTCRVPASVLQMHPDVTFILDTQAAVLLEHKEYYAAD